MKINLAEYYLILKKYEVIIASALVLLIVLILTRIFLISQIVRVTKINADKKLLSEQKKLLLSKERDLTSLNFQFYQDTYPKLNQVLPDNKDYFSLFNTFDLLEQQFNVAILRTEFKLGVVSTQSARLERETGTDAYAIPLSVDVIGDFEKLKQFFIALSDLTRRYINVESIIWKLEETGLVQAKIQAKAYFYPQSRQIDPVSQPLTKLTIEEDELLKKIALNKPVLQYKIQIEDIEVGKRNLFQF